MNHEPRNVHFLQYTYSVRRKASLVMANIVIVIYILPKSQDIPNQIY